MNSTLKGILGAIALPVVVIASILGVNLLAEVAPVVVVALMVCGMAALGYAMGKAW